MQRKRSREERRGDEGASRPDRSPAVARAGCIIRRVIAYGLIGLVVNVLVAWGFAVWGGVGPPRWFSPVPTSERIERVDALEWTRPVPRGVPPRPTLKLESVGRGLRATVQREVDDAGIVYFEYRVWAGFPWATATWSGERFWSGDSMWGDRVDAAVLKLPGKWPDLQLGGWWQIPRRLPVMPTWGLTTNTLVYALGWWGAVVVSGWARTRRLRRRGLCPSCAYDLRGELTGGCPECGWGRAGTTP